MRRIPIPARGKVFVCDSPMALLPASFVLPLIALAGCSTSAGPAPGPARPSQDRASMVESSRLASFVPIGKLEREAAFADYTVCTYRDLDVMPPASFEVLKGGKRVWAQVGWDFVIGLPRDGWDAQPDRGEPPDPKPVPVRVGQDITGDGMPDLVVSEWSGGAHCCLTVYVFEMAPVFRALATIDAKHSDGAYFTRIAGQAGLHFVTSDWAFAYWRTSFAESPAPTVLLRYAGGDYRLAVDQMRKPAPTDDDLRDRADALRRSGSWCDGCGQEGERCPPSRLWGEMLELIYAGNGEAAWRFLDLAWPGDCAAKETFRRDFRQQLRTSAYWGELNRMNSGRL